MTDVVGVVTQEPAFVGWVAALAVVIFLSVVLLLLVVAVGDESVPFAWSDEEPDVDEPEPRLPEPRLPEPRMPVTAARLPLPSPPAARLPLPRPSELRPPIAEAPLPQAVVDGSPASEAAGSALPPSAAGASGTGESYAASMTSSMRSMAVTVVEHAQVHAGDRILDAGTGAVIGASAALASGLAVVPVEPDQGTLAIGRREPRGARAAGAAFASLPFGSSWFDVIISVHALHFAADPRGVLGEWRRVTRAGGRLSLSVPGPPAALGMSRCDPIYRRHGAGLQVHVATRRKLSEWASAAGWQEVEIVADPTTVIRLSGPDSFRTWIRTRTWSDPERALSPEDLAALEEELITAFSVGANGHLQIPFGTLYLTARNP
jgi:SAM-dependent methyltransferase